MNIVKRNADDMQLTLNPQTIVSDFELAIKQAALLAFPNVIYCHIGRIYIGQCWHLCSKLIFIAHHCYLLNCIVVYGWSWSR